MKYSNKKMRQIFTIILFAGFVFTTILHLDVLINILRFLWKICIPFILGFSIAFILNIVMTMLEDTLLKNVKKGKRPLAIVLSVLLILFIIIFVLSSVGPELVNSIQQLIKQLPEAIEYVYNFLKENRNMFNGAFVEPIDYLLKIDTEMIKEALAQYSSTIFSSGVSILTNTFNKLYTFFIALLFAFYLIFSKDVLIRQCKKVSLVLLGKEKTRQLSEVAVLSNEIFSNFISCQCLEACILGAMFVVSMSIANMPYALLIGIVIAITALIPVFGAFLGCFVGIILIAITNPMQAVWFVVLFLFLQQIEGNFIYPHVVGNSIGLPSIWVFASVIVGNELLGILGMFIFIPITSIVYTLFKKYIHKKELTEGIH